MKTVNFHYFFYLASNGVESFTRRCTRSLVVSVTADKHIEDGQSAWI